MSNKSWISSLYPIGKKVNVPCPDTGESKTGTIKAYTYRGDVIDGVTIVFEGDEETILSWITLNLQQMENL